MNGPITMYKLQPIVHFPDPVELITTMYGVKNIYSKSLLGSSEDNHQPQSPNILEQVNKLLKKPPSEVEELRKRQEGILKQLNLLKEQMLSLREELTKGAPSKIPKDKVNNNLKTISTHENLPVKPQWNGIAGEIVFSANPTYPPYALSAVNHVWKNELRLSVVCHTHSSVVAVPDHLSRFNALSLTPNPNVYARLIWSDMGSDCEMVVSPISHSPIRGEVNILRFLNRSIEGFKDPITDTQLDHILDTCHKLAHVHTQRDKQIAVRALNALLGRSPWFGGEKASVADVAAWSVIKKTSGVELSQNMTRWNARCEQAFEPVLCNTPTLA